MALIEKGNTGHVDFAESMRQAEAEAGIPSDSEIYSEYGLTNPEPDETGRVPASRPAEESAPVEAEAPAEQAAPVEEVVEATPDPQAELNKKLGDLINDNAALRAQLEQLTREPEPQPVPQYTGDVSWFDELAESNPTEAVNFAVQNQQPHLFDRAIRAWYEQDPVAAGRYERSIEQQALVQNMQQTFAPQIKGAQDLASKSQMETAMNTVASRHSDFAEVIGTLTAEAAEKIFSDPSFPKDVLQQGLAGDVQSKEQTFETLYRWQKAEINDQLVQAAREAPAQQTEEAREAKLDAFVGSSSTTTPDEVPESEQDRLMRVWDEMKPGLRTGWAGRDTRQRIGR